MGYNIDSFTMHFKYYMVPSNVMYLFFLELHFRVLRLGWSKTPNLLESLPLDVDNVDEHLYLATHVICHPIQNLMYNPH